MGKVLGEGGLGKQDTFPLTRAIFTQRLKQACSVPLPPGWESPRKTSSFAQQHPALAKRSLKPELLRRPVNSQEEVQEASGTAGVTQQEGEVAAGSCRRPQWLLWGLDQGRLWRRVPGEPHLGFHSRWLARGQMLTLLPRNHSRVAIRAGVLA